MLKKITGFHFITKPVSRINEQIWIGFQSIGGTDIRKNTVDPAIATPWELSNALNLFRAEGLRKQLTLSNRHWSQNVVPDFRPVITL